MPELFTSVLLDFNVFEVLGLDVHADRPTFAEIARMKRAATRRRIQEEAREKETKQRQEREEGRGEEDESEDETKAAKAREEQQKLINRAAQALEDYSWSELVSWGLARGYG